MTRIDWGGGLHVKMWDGLHGRSIDVGWSSWT